MALDGEQLAALAAVVETGSFDAAAASLHVTPSAVSQRIKALEQRVGQVLVRRERPCTVTPAGVPLLRLAAQTALLEAEALAEVGGDPVAAALSRRFEEEMGGLADAFKAYMHDWNGQQIADDPDGFETATRGLAAVLADRIRREETQLYRHIPGATPPAEVDAGALRA